MPMVTIDSSESCSGCSGYGMVMNSEIKVSRNEKIFLTKKQRCRPLNVVDHAATLRHNGRQAGKI